MYVGDLSSVAVHQSMGKADALLLLSEMRSPSILNTLKNWLALIGRLQLRHIPTILCLVRSQPEDISALELPELAKALKSSALDLLLQVGQVI
jgi:hypothetical protein